MGKWIEDLNFAIDVARKSQEKSSLFPDAALGDHSNRELLGGFFNLVFCGKGDGYQFNFPQLKMDFVFFPP